MDLFNTRVHTWKRQHERCVWGELRALGVPLGDAKLSESGRPATRPLCTPMWAISGQIGLLLLGSGPHPWSSFPASVSVDKSSWKCGRYEIIKNVRLHNVHFYYNILTLLLILFHLLQTAWQHLCSVFILNKFCFLFLLRNVFFFYVHELCEKERSKSNNHNMEMLIERRKQWQCKRRPCALFKTRVGQHRLRWFWGLRGPWFIIGPLGANITVPRAVSASYANFNLISGLFFNWCEKWQ